MLALFGLVSYSARLVQGREGVRAPQSCVADAGSDPRGRIPNVRITRNTGSEVSLTRILTAG
jgi:hypothetical protein